MNKVQKNLKMKVAGIIEKSGKTDSFEISMILMHPITTINRIIDEIEEEGLIPIEIS